jgi:hypothetical protein
MGCNRDFSSLTWLATEVFPVSQGLQPRFFQLHKTCNRDFFFGYTFVRTKLLWEKGFDVVVFVGTKFFLRTLSFFWLFFFNSVHVCCFFMIIIVCWFKKRYTSRSPTQSKLSKKKSAKEKKQTITNADQLPRG